MKQYLVPEQWFLTLLELSNKLRIIIDDDYLRQKIREENTNLVNDILAIHGHTQSIKGILKHNEHECK